MLEQKWKNVWGEKFTYFNKLQLLQMSATFFPFLDTKTFFRRSEENAAFSSRRQQFRQKSKIKFLSFQSSWDKK
jgi:hypothetical protein